MPWDEGHIKTFEVQKSHRMALDTFRLGVYERAVSILQSGEHTGTRHATAEALHQLLAAAGADNIQAELPEQDEHAMHLDQLNAEAARESKLLAKANKQQHRRERQQRRHEEAMALRNQKYDEKVRARQKAFTAQVSQHKKQQISSLQQLMEQQQGLEEQLTSHQQLSAQLSRTEPADDNERALATLKSQLENAQTKRAYAEEQLQLVRHSSVLQVTLLNTNKLNIHSYISNHWQC